MSSPLPVPLGSSGDNQFRSVGPLPANRMTHGTGLSVAGSVSVAGSCQPDDPSITISVQAVLPVLVPPTCAVEIVKLRRCRQHRSSTLARSDAAAELDSLYMLNNMRIYMITAYERDLRSESSARWPWTATATYAHQQLHSIRNCELERPASRQAATAGVPRCKRRQPSKLYP